MSSALRHLKHFIVAKDTDDERHEIREYILTHVDSLARAFGVTDTTLKTTLARIPDDMTLAKKLHDEIKLVASRRRETRAEERAAVAQQSADVLGAAAYWERGTCHVDIVSLLASALTSRQDHLAFGYEGTEVSIPMDLLYRLAQLERADLTAFVDHEGLHVRWSTGGLNFRSQSIAGVERIHVHLPSRYARKEAA